MLTQSYVHGVSATPLIGDTLGVHFDKAAARWGDREALVVRHQNIRWTYARAEAAGRRLRRRAAGARPRAGRPHRHLVAQQRRMGGDAVRRRQGRPDPGQHQSRPIASPSSNTR